LNDLIARLGSNDINIVAGVLETAASIFDRFRTAPDTDPVRKEVRYCLDIFSGPLLVIANSLNSQLDNATNANANRQILSPILTSLRLVVTIFFSLSWLELPDVFEDKFGEWMTLFRKFLTFVIKIL
jgi:exportin-2 (importin alpha re-exporter)